MYASPFDGGAKEATEVGALSSKSVHGKRYLGWPHGVYARREEGLNTFNDVGRRGDEWLGGEVSPGGCSEIG